jgi:phosphomannomutase
MPITKRGSLDGVKVYLGDAGSRSRDAGWLMIRGSGTEPMLRLYAETNSPATTRTILDSTAAFVRSL